VAFLARAIFGWGWRGGWYGSGYGAWCAGPPYAAPAAYPLPPEESLRVRLAKGEIDAAEYERERDALRGGAR
jgi:hypothetical protein